MKALGICVNPMSGRDVRRLAGRASTMTHEAKRDIVARIATGADAMGVTDIFVTREPFRIASAALEQIPLRARVHVIEHALTNTASDSELSLQAYLDAGCRSFVSLGGDGTNRALVRTLGGYKGSNSVANEVVLVPLSTGTNNVFPVLAEPTIAGAVAGLYAAGRLPALGETPVGEPGALAERSKVLHLSVTRRQQRCSAHRCRAAAQRPCGQSVAVCRRQDRPSYAHPGRTRRGWHVAHRWLSGCGDGGGMIAAWWCISAATSCSTRLCHPACSRRWAWPRNSEFRSQRRCCFRARACWPAMATAITNSTMVRLRGCNSCGMGPGCLISLRLCATQPGPVSWPGN